MPLWTPQRPWRVHQPRPQKRSRRSAFDEMNPATPAFEDPTDVFRFADGRTGEAQNMVEQPITAGLLQGKTINMHLIDRNGNETSPLFSIDDQRRHRMVVDYEENKVMFKDRPGEWHTLPTTKKGLLMIPLTKEACERHAPSSSSTAPPPPEPVFSNTDGKKRRRRKKVCKGCKTQ